MATTALTNYESVPSNPETLERLVGALTKLWGCEPRISASYVFADGGTDIVHVDCGSLPTLIPIAPPIRLLTFYTADLTGPTLSLFVIEEMISVDASAPSMSSASQLKALSVEALGLVPFSPPDDNRVTSLERRVDAVQRLQEGHIPLRCFLSFRFTEADSAVARELERFLSLHAVEVVTGQSYEPRRVEDKVRSRLSGIDFVVYLLTGTGGSGWVRDEISEARASGVPVIPLVENEAAFEQGLFGNIEHIPFKEGHIGDVWIGLTEAMAFIRAQRTRSIEPPA